MSTSPLAYLTGSTIELLVSCSDLADLDEFTKSDPLCVLFVKQFGQWKEYGRTEARQNTLNPKFTQSFLLEFDADLPQSLLFTVYDIDNRSTDLSHHDLVGSYEASISDLLQAGSQLYTTCKTLRGAGDSRARGIISITSEVVHQCKDRLSLHVGAQKLERRGKIITAKPDVYLEISRSIDNVSFHPVFRTETIIKSQKPRWRPFELGLQRLCNGDWDRILEFSCWHHSDQGEYKMLGRQTTSLRELKALKPNGHYKELVLVPKKKDNHRSSVKITKRGCITFFKFRIDHQFSFLDYVRGGLQLRPIIGIDFTSSNGHLHEQLCLHDISKEMETSSDCQSVLIQMRRRVMRRLIWIKTVCNSNQKFAGNVHKGNQYIDVMESLGAIVTQYNPDQSAAMFGFGAKVMDSDKTSHCFPLSGDWGNVNVEGIEKAIQLYKETVKRVSFSGPTKVKPLIAMAESLAVREPTQDNQIYNVLIVITDGVINDIDDVIERLVSVSHLPLSVIFLGVGPADFAIMDIFNHHSVHHLSLVDRQVSSTRKHTHFVAYPQEKGYSCVSRDFMAKDAFAVLCTQVVDYMKSKSIVPNRPKLGTNNSIDLLLELEDEAKDTVSLRSLSSVNAQSQKLQEKSGPRCPTCGSALEPGSFLYSEIS